MSEGLQKPKNIIRGSPRGRARGDYRGRRNFRGRSGARTRPTSRGGATNNTNITSNNSESSTRESFFEKQGFSQDIDGERIKRFNDLISGNKYLEVTLKL